MYNLPPKSEFNNYCSIEVFIFVGKRKYKGMYSFHFKNWYKSGYHYESTKLENISGWSEIPKNKKQYKQYKENILNYLKRDNLTISEKQILDYYNSGISSSQLYHELLELL